MVYLRDNYSFKVHNLNNTHGPNATSLEDLLRMRMRRRAMQKQDCFFSS